MELEVHLDGSGVGDVSWSIVVLCKDRCGCQFFGGALTGRVISDPASKSFVGACVHDASAAEMTDFVWAIAFALQIADASLEKCKIMYDSEFGARSARSTWSSGGHMVLSRFESSLCNMLAAMVQLSHEHEKAHSDLPYNELVDSLRTCFNEQGPASDFAANHAEAQWASIALLPPAQQAQYPYCEQNGDMFLSLEMCPVARWGVDSRVIAKKIDGFLGVEKLETTDSKSHRSLPIRLVQVNPCTLREDEAEVVPHAIQKKTKHTPSSCKSTGEGSMAYFRKKEILLRVQRQTLEDMGDALFLLQISWPSAKQRRTAVSQIAFCRMISICYMQSRGC